MFNWILIVVALSWSRQSGAVALHHGLVAQLIQAPTTEIGLIEPRVQKFVHQRYIHGVPESEAKELGHGAAKVLSAMLTNSAEKDSWTNIVETLGYVGGVESRDALLAFLAKGRQGSLGHAEFKALALVPIALGHVAENGDMVAEAYLEKLTDVRKSPAKAFGWRYGSYGNGQLTKLFAEIGVSGLNLTGKSGEKFLRQLRVRALSDPDSKFLLDDINSALDELEHGRGRDRDDGQVVCSPDEGTVGAGIKMHSITVSKHIKLGTVDSELDSIMRTVTLLLEKNDNVCPEEIECPVELRFTGKLSTFGAIGDRLEIIKNKEDMDKVLMIPGNFKIVDSIIFCGKPRNALGCTFAGSSIVEGASPPDVWAHEFGHTRGLRDIHKCAGRIMSGGSSNTKAVDANECICFSRP